MKFTQASPNALYETGHIHIVPLDDRIDGAGTGLEMATFA
jgi:hypothetical protein